VLLPLKVLAPVQCVEHMADWTMVAISLGIEQEGGDDYALGVSIMVNPTLAKALEGQEVKDPAKVARQVMIAAREALNGFLGGPPSDMPGEDVE
jgi:hypothetical protein